MAVPVVNIVIETDTDFSRTFNLKKSDNTPLNLTNYTFDAHMRKHLYSSENRGVAFGATYGVDPTLGALTITLDDTVSGFGSLTSGRYHYDVIIMNSNNNKKTKVITGQAKVNGTTGVTITTGFGDYY